MRLGLCCSPSQAREAVRAGFDYVELPGYLLTVGEQFVDLPVEVCNLLFVGDLNIWWNIDAVQDHLVSLIEGADNAGVGLLVVGGGGARRADDDDDLELKNRQFVDFCDWMQTIADRHDIIVAPESLNRDETNVGNDYAALSRALAKKACGHTADSYHILKESGGSRDWEALVPLRPDHVHLSDIHRSFGADDDPDLLGFLRRLKSLGYKNRISFEGHWEGSLKDLHSKVEATVSRVW